MTSPFDPIIDNEKVKEKITPPPTKEEAIASIKENYKLIIQALKKYCDIEENYYPIIALWTIGTWFHDCFNTYPFLFVNAIKSSGKTRLLKLLSHLVKEGDIQASISDAVLFRTAKGHTIILDEFENIGSKERATLRELLNAAYKKGLKVKRMKKIKNNRQEEQIVQEFDLYTPICMANIFGMDEVVESRCISIILEKSNKAYITRLIEDFENDITIKKIKANFIYNLVSFWGVVSQKKTMTLWNDYVLWSYNDITALTTQRTQNNITTLNILEEEKCFFDKLFYSDIDGRHLELFFPLFILADIIGKEEFDSVLNIARHIISEKKHEESIESKDISLLLFIANHAEIGWYNSYIPITELTSKFKNYLREEGTEDTWLNTKWMGRALRRLKLIKVKRRLKQGREIILDIEKAKDKSKIFIEIEKPIEEKDHKRSYDE